MIVAKFSTLRGGVFIEVTDCKPEYSANDRCFRFDEKGNAEYAFYGDLMSSNPAPRWYAYQYKYEDFFLA